MAKIIYWYKHSSKKKVRNDCEKLINHAVFGKTMDNVRKHRHIKLTTTERRRNCLVLEPNYHTTKFFRENLLAVEMKKTKQKQKQKQKKTQILMNKPVYLALSILELIKNINTWVLVWLCKTRILSKLCHMDTQIHDFIVYEKEMTLQKMLKLDLVLQIMS